MKKTIAVLNRLEKDGIIGHYAIGGAMAATFYVEPFTTFDLDVFAVLAQKGDSPLLSLTPIYQALHEMGYSDDKECVMVEGVPVQLWIGKQMEKMDRNTGVIDAKFPFSKENHRRDLRLLSFPEKVKRVVELQRIAAPVMLARGRQVRTWDIQA